jgi:hypothetical protein
VQQEEPETRGDGEEDKQASNAPVQAAEWN